MWTRCREVEKSKGREGVGLDGKGGRVQRGMLAEGAQERTLDRTIPIPRRLRFYWR